MHSAARSPLRGAVIEQFPPKPKPRAFGSLSAEELDRTEFEEVREVIPGLLPAGLALLAGKPKFGKSYAALEMAIAVASGGRAFNFADCPAGDVLYMALEDSPRRLKRRMAQMLPFDPARPAGLYFATQARRIGEGLDADLIEWLAAHPDARLVILDTWARIKPKAGNRSAYDEDAEALTPLHGIANDHPAVAFVVIHHTRKMDAEDVFDTISGTNGLGGIADTLLVMSRHGEGAKLSGQGRDIEGFKKALERDKLTGGWRIVGDAKQLAKTGERQAILDVLAEAGDEPVSVATVAMETGKSKTNAVHLLKRLIDEGKVRKVGHGKYALADHAGWDGGRGDADHLRQHRLDHGTFVPGRHEHREAAGTGDRQRIGDGARVAAIDPEAPP